MWSYSVSVHEFVAHGKWRLSATKGTYLFMANILVLSLTDSWVASCLQVAYWSLLLEALPPFVNLGNRKRLKFGTLALVVVKAPKVSHFLRYITYNTNAVNKVAISCLLFPIAVLALFKLQTSGIIHQPRTHLLRVPRIFCLIQPIRTATEVLNTYVMKFWYHYL